VQAALKAFLYGEISDDQLESLLAEGWHEPYFYPNTQLFNLIHELLAQDRGQ